MSPCRELRKKLILTRASKRVKEGHGSGIGRAQHTEKSGARHYESRKLKATTHNTIEETRHSPNVQLAGFSQRQVQFSWRLPCRVQSFAFNVTGRKASAIAKSIARFPRGR